MIAQRFCFESGPADSELPTPGQFVMIRAKRLKGASAPQPRTRSRADFFRIFAVQSYIKMSAIEESKRDISVPQATTAKADSSPSLVTRALNLLSSVRFGVVMLCTLAAACMVGMLIMQQHF